MRKAWRLARLLAVVILGVALTTLAMPLPPCADDCCGCCPQKSREATPECGCTFEAALPDIPHQTYAPAPSVDLMDWPEVWTEFPPLALLWPSSPAPRTVGTVEQGPPGDLRSRGPPCVR